MADTGASISYSALVANAGRAAQLFQRLGLLNLHRLREQLPTDDLAHDLGGAACDPPDP
jgi:hypothetical protein